MKDPPVVPGECRSCGTTTKEHANDCQYIAIKDNIGLCTYCGAQDHRYAACPQRIVDHRVTHIERSKNKKNRKKGRVKILAGVVTREQDSDSTLPPEEGGRKEEIPSPSQQEGMVRFLSLQLEIGEGRIMTPPHEVVCSFCGVANHNHKECPVMHQYIREQADALAQRRMEEYSQLQEWVGYRPPPQMPIRQETTSRGGRPHEGESAPDQSLWRQETVKQGSLGKGGMIGSMYPHIIKGMAPLGEVILHPHIKRDLLLISQKMRMMKKKEMRQMTKPPLYPLAAKPLWRKSNKRNGIRGKRLIWVGLEAHLKIQMTLCGEGMVGGLLGAIEASKGGLGSLDEMEPRDLWDLWAPEDSLEGMDYQPHWALCPLLDLEFHWCSMQI